MKLRAITVFLVALAALPTLVGQVRVNKPVHLTGANPEDRQVLGVPLPVAADDLIPAATEQAASHRSAVAGTNWSITLPLLTVAPVEGMQLNVIAPAPSSGPISISVNGSGPYAVLHAPDDPLLGADVPEGTPLSLVFDGASFQLLQGAVHRRRPCPEGLVAVNDQYCIAVEEAPVGMSFFAAVELCGALGQRLCSWGEFLAACYRSTELGLIGMTGNWEWTNDAANEDGNARVVGNLSCGSASTGNVTANWRPRCCASR